MLSRASGSTEEVKSRIREAAAQAHTESPPAAFLLRACFAVSEAGVGA